MTTKARQTGIIKTVNAEKGFGFIKRDGDKDVFFHVSELDEALAFDDTLRNLRVEFDVIPGDKGPRATRIRKAD